MRNAYQLVRHVSGMNQRPTQIKQATNTQSAPYSSQPFRKRIPRRSREKREVARCQRSPQPRFITLARNINAQRRHHVAAAADAGHATIAMLDHWHASCGHNQGCRGGNIEGPAPVSSSTTDIQRKRQTAYQWPATCRYCVNRTGDLISGLALCAIATSNAPICISSIAVPAWPGPDLGSVPGSS